jgi:NTE family protein
MKEVGVVLGGGGSKGAYEVGVWKAVEELEFNVTAICGTSIGAINGAVIAQGDFELLARMWMEISLDNIVCTPYADEDNLLNLKNLPHIAGDIYKNQTLDITPLKLLLDSFINEDKIRASSIDYGLSTFSVTDKKSMDIWKSDIPLRHMTDYILASASLFGIPSTSINDKLFFDGCVQNNIPINMMIEKGYKDIIAVDVGGIGIVKNIDLSGINLFSLKCSENIIGLMDFNTAKISKTIKMGYLDTFKLFGRLSGNKYYMESENYNESKTRYSQNILNGIEAAASAFSIDRFVAYDVDGLIKKVIHRYKRYDVYYQKLKDVLSQDSILNILTQKKIKLNDALIVTWIADLLKSQKRDFIKNKLIMNLLGDNYHAASALAYLMRE